MKKILTTTILTAFIANFVFAQIQEVKAYSLKEAVEYAVANNVAVKKSEVRYCLCQMAQLGNCNTRSSANFVKY